MKQPLAAGRQRPAVFCLLAAAVFVGLSLAGAFTTPALAQQVVERRSIIDMIFGSRPARNYPPPPERAAPPPRARQAAPRRSSQPAPPQAAPAAAAVEKAENAAKVLVIGDFMASGLAEGLKATFAEDPGIAVVERTNGSSGLVRDDYYDWHGELPAILEETDPAAVVVMLGSNDRQDIRIDNGSAPLRSDAWVSEYEERVEELAGIVNSAGVPLLWVGAPAFRSSRMTADILAINDIYRASITETVGTFVDIWDGFVDEDGQFIFTGSDVQGQQVRLRGSDGINMTAAGKRKLAFYAEKAIRRVVQPDEGGNSDALAATSPRPDDGSDKERRVLAPELAVRTSAMRIADPAFDGGASLLGEVPTPSSTPRSPRDRLLATGATSEAPSGRADNFAWPPREAAAEETRVQDTSARAVAGGRGDPAGPHDNEAVTAIIQGEESAL